MELIAFHEADELAQRIAQKLEKSLAYATIEHFADGELYVTLDAITKYTGKSVGIILSTSRPVLDHIMAISFLSYRLRQYNVQSITAVIPYFGYSRQERDPLTGKPGPAALIARLFSLSGIDKVITVQLHSNYLLESFTIPCYTINPATLIAQIITPQTIGSQTCLVAPDSGIEKLVVDIAEKTGLKIIRFRKERYGQDQTKIVGKIGDCRAAHAIIIDDIIDTGGTALHVAQELRTNDFSTITGVFVHPVLSGNARELIEHGPFDKIYVSNSIPLDFFSGTKIAIFDLSSIIVEQILKIESLQKR